MSRIFHAVLLLGAVVLGSDAAQAQNLGQFSVQAPVQNPGYSYRGYVPNYGYGYGYSAPYRSSAYPHGVSRLGPVVYPAYSGRYYSGYRQQYIYPQVRVRRTPSRSSTFGGAHSSHYFGDPHASQYFGN